MSDIDLNGHARRLLEAYGPKASLIAAQKARGHEERGDAVQAETWRRLEIMIADLRSADVG
jgi:hypothetical protein